jgi:hypothetical protein
MTWGRVERAAETGFLGSGGGLSKCGLMRVGGACYTAHPAAGSDLGWFASMDTAGLSASPAEKQDRGARR